MALPFYRSLLCSALPAALLLTACADKQQTQSPLLPSMPESIQSRSGGSGSESFSSATAVSGSSGANTKYNGQSASSVVARDLDGGIVLPDGAGGVIRIQGDAFRKQDAGYVDAREIRLKARELAEQLISGIRDHSLYGAVALPVSFVNLDNLDQTSGFGRLMAEQMFFEFNQRGFPIREYRIPADISVNEDGEFYLSRALGDIAVESGNVVIVGTYYADSQAIFVNARLVRPADGRVLRTAGMVMKANGVTRRMLRSTGVAMEAGSLRVRDYNETLKPVILNPVDSGADVH